MRTSVNNRAVGACDANNYRCRRGDRHLLRGRVHREVAPSVTTQPECISSAESKGLATRNYQSQLF
jgi:hypothetical protein